MQKLVQNILATYGVYTRVLSTQLECLRCLHSTGIGSHSVLVELLIVFWMKVISEAALCRTSGGSVMLGQF